MKIHRKLVQAISAVTAISMTFCFEVKSSYATVFNITYTCEAPYQNPGNIRSSRDRELARRYNVMLSSLRGNTIHSRGHRPVTPVASQDLFALNITAPSLVVGSNTVTLYIDPANLFLLGFSNTVTRDVYYFQDAGYLERLRQQLGSSFNYRSLVYSGNYTDLERDPRATRPLEVRRSYIYRADNIINGPIATLARFNMNNDNSNDIRPDLIVMIQWISEAARFEELRRLMMIGMSNSEVDINTQRVPDDLIALQNRWGDLSFSIRPANVNPDGTLITPLNVTRVLDQSRPLRYPTLSAVTNVLGVVLGSQSR